MRWRTCQDHMPHPEFYPEGTTPRRKDTRLRLWKKILGVYQNAAGALATNNPRIKDTLRKTKLKVNKSQQGVA